MWNISCVYVSSDVKTWAQWRFNHGNSNSSSKERNWKFGFRLQFWVNQIIKCVNKKVKEKICFRFELSDGVKRQEQGFLKNSTTENPLSTPQQFMVVTGSYEYVVNGYIYRTDFIADEVTFNNNSKISKILLEFFLQTGYKPTFTVTKINTTETNTPS